METGKKPNQKNDNKALKETGAKNLLTAVLESAGKTLTKHERLILEEFLLHGKTYAEVKDSRWLPHSLQKRHFENGINRLINNLQKMDNKLLECDRTHTEVSKVVDELADTKQELERVKDILQRKQKMKPEVQALLLTPILELDLSSRIKNACEAFDVLTLSDLVRLKRNDFLVKRNLGQKSAKEIDSYFKRYGLSWNMNI